MIYLSIAFIIFLLMCCSYAVWYGGSDAKAAVFMMVTATALTRMVTGLSHDQWPLAIVDGLLLVGLLHIALKSNAFWPLWSTAFHATTMAAHAAVAFSERVDVGLMFGMTSIWSLFSLFVMPLGIVIDRRAGLAQR